MDITVKNAFITLEKYLKPVEESRFQHSCRVAKISVMLALCSRKNLTLYDFEIFENPTALHSQVRRMY